MTKLFAWCLVLGACSICIFIYLFNSFNIYLFKLHLFSPDNFINNKNNNVFFLSFCLFAGKQSYNTLLYTTYISGIFRHSKHVPVFRLPTFCSVQSIQFYWKLKTIFPPFHFVVRFDACQKYILCICIFILKLRAFDWLIWINGFERREKPTQTKSHTIRFPQSVNHLIKKKRAATVNRSQPFFLLVSFYGFNL